MCKLVFYIKKKESARLAHFQSVHFHRDAVDSIHYKFSFSATGRPKGISAIRYLRKKSFTLQNVSLLLFSSFFLGKSNKIMKLKFYFPCFIMTDVMHSCLSFWLFTDAISLSHYQQEHETEEEQQVPSFLTIGQKYSIAVGSTVVLPCKINETGEYQ